MGIVATPAVFPALVVSPTGIKLRSNLIVQNHFSPFRPHYSRTCHGLSSDRRGEIAAKGLRCLNEKEIL